MERRLTEKFFDTFDWLLVIVSSQQEEGINVNGLEAVLFMRSMDYIGSTDNRECFDG